MAPEPLPPAGGAGSAGPAGGGRLLPPDGEPGMLRGQPRS